MERNGRQVRYYVVRVGGSYSVVEKTDQELTSEGLDRFMVGTAQNTYAEALELKRAYESAQV